MFFYDWLECSNCAKSVLEILLRAFAVMDYDPPKAPDRHRDSCFAPILGWI